MKRKSTPPPDPKGGATQARPVDKRIASYGKDASDKKAQSYDRLEAIQALADMKTPEAAAAMLKRFTFIIDPSITDQEEKEIAFQGVVGAGVECVPAVMEFAAVCIKKGEPITWLLKILHELLDDAPYEEELVKLLGSFDTEYARNVEPKVQVIQALEEVVSTAAREAVEPFLEDVNETVRFHAVQTTFAQNSPESIPAMVKLLEAEESVRVKNKVAEGLLFRAWVIPTELRAAASQALRETSGYRIGSDGKVSKSANH